MTDSVILLSALFLLAAGLILYRHHKSPGRHNGGTRIRTVVERAWGPKDEAGYTAAASIDGIQPQVPDGLQIFIQNQVIPQLNGQRTREDQFAVLILRGDGINNIQLRNKYPSCQLVNPSVPSFPDFDSHLDNYIVARPDHNQYRHVHAEKILLDRLEALITKDEYYPTIVILYSWMMPCSGCTSALIQSLSNHGSNIIDIVVYTIDWKGVDLDTNQQNRQRLHQAGIQVYKVDYNCRLPPV